MKIVDFFNIFLLLPMVHCIKNLFNKGGYMHDVTKMMFELVIENAPDRIPPTTHQESIMNKVKENSGIAIVQDKGSAYIALGPRMQTTEGVFIGKDKNPRFKQDVIVLNSHANAAYWYSVLFHELAHATGTTARLNREGITGKEDANAYNYEEIIAEMVARRIMARLGLETRETVDRSQRYINMYAMKIETPINSIKLNLEIEAAENVVMEWLQGVEFKAA